MTCVVLEKKANLMAALFIDILKLFKVSAIRPTRADAMTSSALQQRTTNDEAVESVQIHTLTTIIVTIAQAMFPYHLSEQGAARAHLGNQTFYHDHNVIFRKPLLN